MRTTVNLTPDVEAEVARLRREQGLGVSDAVVVLARRGINAASTGRSTFSQRTASLGAKIDVSNISEVVDLLDEAE